MDTYILPEHDMSIVKAKNLFHLLHEHKESRFPDLECEIMYDHYGTLFIVHPWLKCFITYRPAYCNRGKYLVHVDQWDYIYLSIDSADYFPRYYFFEDTLVKEILHWFNLRIEAAEKKYQKQVTVSD